MTASLDLSLEYDYGTLVKSNNKEYKISATYLLCVIKKCVGGSGDGGGGGGSGVCVCVLYKRKREREREKEKYRGEWGGNGNSDKSLGSRASRTPRRRVNMRILQRT